MNIHKIKDISNAKQYMVQQLTDGTTLARLVMKDNDFSRGTFRLPMPIEVDQSQPLDFGSGNVRLNGDEEKTFAHMVTSFIRAPGCALIIQDNEARISDPIMERLPYRRLALEYNAEVYWRVSSSDLPDRSDDKILDIIHSSSYFPWTGFFYRDDTSHITATLQYSDLEYIVAHVIGVAVGALDYRSFLIWWRDELHPFPVN